RVLHHRHARPSGPCRRPCLRTRRRCAMSKPPNLAGLLESFFRRRLIEQRNVSPLTVVTYRDALRLLVLYASERIKREPCRLEVRDLDRDVVLGFLEHVERNRGNGP